VHHFLIVVYFYSRSLSSWHNKISKLWLLPMSRESNDWPTLLNFRDRTPKRNNRGAIEFLEHFFPLLPTLIPLSGVGTTCFYHVVIKIRQLFVRPAACLTSTLLETGVGANDCKSTEELEIINFGHPSYDWPFWPVLSFPRSHAERTDHSTIELLSSSNILFYEYH
jgi:hypothetical protein